MRLGDFVSSARQSAAKADIVAACEYLPDCSNYLYEGWHPFKLVDISAANLHMDLERVEALVKSPKVGGLLYAHTYRDSPTPNDFFQSLKSINPGLIIVDDRCLCIPEFEAP